MNWEQIGSVLAAMGIGSVLSILVKAWIDGPKRRAELKKAVGEAEHAAHLSQAQIAELFSSTAGRLVEAQNLQINELQKDFRDLKAENAGLICEIGRLEGMIDHLRDEIAMKNDEALAMQQEIRTLKRKLDEKNTEIEKLEQENDALRERVSELERRLEKLIGKEGE